MPGTAFVVGRSAFHTVWAGQADPDPEYAAAFTDRAAAEDHARRLDREYKRANHPVEPNPFDRHRLDELTSFPEYALRDWLLDAGISPPAVAALPTGQQLRGLTAEQKEEEIELAGRRVWADWWAAVMVGKTLTAEQTERVWEGFNLYAFHVVRPVEAADPVPPAAGPAPPQVYAVVHRHWSFNDSFYDETQALLRVFRTRVAAEAECKRLNSETQPGEDGRDEWYTFTVLPLDYDPAEG
jgi:hypothetical protein